MSTHRQDEDDEYTYTLEGARMLIPRAGRATIRPRIPLPVLNTVLRAAPQAPATHRPDDDPNVVMSIEGVPTRIQYGRPVPRPPHQPHNPLTALQEEPAAAADLQPPTAPRAPAANRSSPASQQASRPQHIEGTTPAPQGAPVASQGPVVSPSHDEIITSIREELTHFSSSNNETDRHVFRVNELLTQLTILLGDNCYICDAPSGSPHSQRTTPCGHAFHTPCIVQWLQQSHACPMCRARVTIAELHPPVLRDSLPRTSADPPRLHPPQAPELRRTMARDLAQAIVALLDTQPQQQGATEQEAGRILGGTQERTQALVAAISAIFHGSNEH